MGWGDTLGSAYNSASDKARSAAQSASNAAESAYAYARDKEDAAQGIYKDGQQKVQEAEQAYADAQRRVEEARAAYEAHRQRAEAAADAARAAADFARNNPEAAAAQAAQAGVDAAQQKSEQAAAAIEQAEQAREMLDAADGEMDAFGFARDVARAAADTAQQAAQKAKALVTPVIDAAIGIAQSAFNAIEQFFSPKKKAGTPVQPCPVPPKPTPTPTPTPTPPPPPPPPPPDDINIVSVDWLDGDDVTIIGAPDQWVNLPSDAKWLTGSGIPNIDRLGMRPRFIVKFDQPRSAGFQWRIVEVAGGTPAYTATEEARNGNFVASSKTWSMGSASNGQAIMANAAQVVAGGGYKFQIEAKDDKGKVVKSGILTTKRLFWYVELPMTGLANALTSTASVDSEFGSHHMTLKQLPDLSIPLQENIGTNADSATLSANVDAAVAGNATATAKAPYLVRITYTDHLAVKNPNQRQRRTGVQVGPGRPAAALAVSAPGLRPPNTVASRALWNNLVTGESWFVRAEYTPDAGGAAIAIPADKVTSPDAGDDKRNISVDVTGLPAGTGTIDVYVDVVDRMRAGLALGGAANICVCTIAWWTAQSQGEQAGVVIHELGHKVQAVPAGRAIEPDRVATQYDNAGHVGSHCHNGCAAGQANYATSANNAASTCVMFGSTNGQNAFCGNCAPAMKKVDISAGF